MSAACNLLYNQIPLVVKQKIVTQFLLQLRHSPQQIYRMMEHVYPKNSPPIGVFHNWCLEIKEDMVEIMEQESNIVFYEESRRLIDESDDEGKVLFLKLVDFIGISL